MINLKNQLITKTNKKKIEQEFLSNKCGQQILKYQTHFKITLISGLLTLQWKIKEKNKRCTIQMVIESIPNCKIIKIIHEQLRTSLIHVLIEFKYLILNNFTIWMIIMMLTMEMNIKNSMINKMPIIMLNHKSNEIQFQGYDPIKKKMVKIMKKPTRINMDKSAYETMIQMFKIYDKKQQQLKYITFSKISDAIGYNQAVISNYYEEYRGRLDGGRRMGRPMLRHISIDNSTYGSTNVKVQRLSILEGIINKNPYLSRKELRDQLNKYDHLKPPNKQISSTMVSQLLNEAGYRQKKSFISSFDRNTAQVLQFRRQYCQRIKQLREANEPIYYFDFNEFNIYNIRQKVWYNKKTYIPEFQISDFLAGDENLVFLALMNDQGVAEWEVQYKSSIAKSIVGYFQILVKKMNLTQDENITNHIFIDKEKFPENVLKSLTENNYSLKVYNGRLQALPPKSSLMNPIESWFQIIKSRMTNKNFNTNSQLKCEFLKQMARTQKQQMKQNFVKTEVFMGKGLKRQPF